MSLLDPVLLPAKTALLVDAENLGPAMAGRVLLQAGQQGWPPICRAFGHALRCPDWAQAPGFRFVHTGTGKNAADMALTVDAMALVAEGVTVLYIASSDGDFTYLALHLRERGITVFGIGEPKAPEVFRRACVRFFELGAATVPPLPVVQATPATSSATVPPVPTEAQVLKLACAILKDQGGEMPIYAIGQQMSTRHNVRIGALPDKTWRNFLTRRAVHFACDPKGPDAKVRLISGVG